MSPARPSRSRRRLLPVAPVGGGLQPRILAARGHRVMLDEDLADLYRVPTKALLQAVRRNPGRFPADFMFRLRPDEVGNLRSQTVTSSSKRSGWGGRRGTLFAFTEQGVAMLSSVLRSERAVRVNVEIMRAFVRLRRMAAEHHDLRRRIAALEKTSDARFATVFAAIRDLMSPPPEPAGEPIGFKTTPTLPPGKPRASRRVR